MTLAPLGLAAAFAAVAFLYATVGHAGASGYLAVMALAGMAPAAMKPTALILNLVVATLGTIQFARAGHFRWRTLWPFALGSIPLAFLGGALKLPVSQYKAIVGLVLLFSAWRLFVTAPIADATPTGTSDNGGRPEPPLAASIPLGAALGFVSGLTGVGGGIFLSPLLLLFGWASPRRTAAVSAAFILVNSFSGLLGHVASLESVPPDVVFWAPAVAIAGFGGATLGSTRLPNATIRRLLSAVLALAGGKLLFGG